MTLPSSLKLKEKSKSNSEPEKPNLPPSLKKKENPVFKDIADDFIALGEYGKTALKGGIEGISRLGQMMGSTRDIRRRGAKTGSEQLQEQTKNLDKLIPTDDEFGQRVLRRGLKLAPSAIASPFGSAGGTAARSLAAGGLGESAESLGVGELGQSIAELTAYTSPNFTKGLVERGKYKPLIQAAKKFGMSEEQIAPLIQSQFKQKWLSKIAKKTGKAEEALSNTKSALDQSYQTLKESPEALKTLSQKDTNDLLMGLSDIANEIPSELRDKISKDMIDLVSKPVTGKSLFNIWKDINFYVGKGDKQIGLFKEPVRKAISSVSPELSKDFELMNELYKKYYPVAKNLKPHVVDRFVSAVENLGLLGSVATFNFPAMKIVLGEKAARLLSREMLTNKRFQQISQKMVMAVEDNRMPIFQKSAQELQELTDKYLGKIQKNNRKNETNDKK